jgi:hypothetical protein
MDPDDILRLEAINIMREASDELLELAELKELDLNSIARNELRSRRASEPVRFLRRRPSRTVQ